MTDLTVILGSGGVVAGIVAAKELIMWAINRKAQKQDKKEEKADASCELKRYMEEAFKQLRELSTKQSEEIALLKEMVADLNVKNQHQLNALQAQLGNTIQFLAGKYLKRGKITIDELTELEYLYQAYHLCDGNGPRTELMNHVRKLRVVGVVPEEK